MDLFLKILYWFIGISFVLGILAYLTTSFGDNKDDYAMSKKTYNKYIDDAHFNTIWAKIRPKYIQYREEYIAERRRIVEVARRRYLFFFWPGFFYMANFDKDQIMAKLKLNIQELMEDFIRELIKEKIKRAQNEFVDIHMYESYISKKNRYTMFKAFVERHNSIKPQVVNKRTIDNRINEKELIYRLVKIGILSPSYFGGKFDKKHNGVKKGTIFSVSIDRFRIDSNVKVVVSRDRGLSFEIFNYCISKQEIYYEKNSEGRTVTREEIEPVSNGIICFINKPIFVKTNLSIKNKRKFLEVREFDIPEYSPMNWPLAYPGIHELLDIHLLHDDNIQIRELFQPRFAEDLIEYSKKDNRGYSIFSNYDESTTAIIIENIDNKNLKDLSLINESSTNFFINENYAKHLIAKDYYVLEKFFFLASELDDVYSFEESYL